MVYCGTIFEPAHNLSGGLARDQSPGRLPWCHVTYLLTDGPHSGKREVNNYHSQSWGGRGCCRLPRPGDGRQHVVPTARKGPQYLDQDFDQMGPSPHSAAGCELMGWMTKVPKRSRTQSSPVAHLHPDTARRPVNGEVIFATDPHLPFGSPSSFGRPTLDKTPPKGVGRLRNDGWGSHPNGNCAIVGVRTPTLRMPSRHERRFLFSAANE